MKSTKLDTAKTEISAILALSIKTSPMYLEALHGAVCVESLNLFCLKVFDSSESDIVDRGLGTSVESLADAYPGVWKKLLSLRCTHDPSKLSALPSNISA